jgi:hypothetical protein
VEEAIVAKNQYRDKRWKKFRAEIIHLFEYQCLECGKHQNDGAVLQVHHKNYDSGRAIWDYGPDEVEALCKGCHARKHGKIMPQTNWVCVGDNDLGDLVGTCERCGNDLRYEFYVEHEIWSPLTVGTECCDQLTDTKIATYRKKYYERRIQFLSDKNWKKHEQKQFRIFGKQFIEIYERNKYYSVTIGKKVGKFPKPRSILRIKMYIYKILRCNFLKQ